MMKLTEEHADWSFVPFEDGSCELETLSPAGADLVKDYRFL